MHTARYSFGYCTFNHGQYIIVGGGAYQSYYHLSEVEVYDTNKDEWYILPSFNMEKYSSSLVNVNDKVIYSFGGAYAN